jgi:phospholipid/cholesterol/gamma-HCH transport system substrate-binding protein
MKLETRVGLFILMAIGVFLYLSINIRALRFDRDQYFTYKAYFDDTSGLTVKSPVKIAGVEVGWVDSVRLLEDGKAELLMSINKNIRLAKSAHAMIHQDGLIGTKNLEIDPGDPSTGMLMPGSTLAMPGRTPASVGELLDQFRDIATTIQDIASSFKNVFATHQGQDNMHKALTSVTQATDRIANFAEVLNRTMQHNEHNLNAIVSDLRESLAQVKETIPSVKDGIQKFGDATGKAGEAFDNISDAAVAGRETLREAGEVVEKVNAGKGILGKLINEDEMYTDIKKTVRGFKDYVNKAQSVLLSIDMHSESMVRQKYSKGYFDLRLRPNSDYFYQVQLAVDERGSVTNRDESYTRYTDSQGNQMNPTLLNLPLEYKVWLAEKQEVVKVRKNDLLFGLQFGKRFDRLALRVGLFESTFGVAADYYVPLQTDKIHWITSLEAFDLGGTRRPNPLDPFTYDRRPHVKWSNKLFFMRNLYTTFGLDDVVSKRSANPFWGGGLRFNDDDLKYFLSSLSSAKVSR